MSEKLFTHTQSNENNINNTNTNTNNNNKSNINNLNGSNIKSNVNNQNNNSNNNITSTTHSGGNNNNNNNNNSNNNNNNTPNKQHSNNHNLNKRLPIDISRDTLMDPVNIPSKFKLFQASTNNIGSIFGCLQYTLFDGLRVSARSLDSRLKVTYEKQVNGFYGNVGSSSSSNISKSSLHSPPPIKTSISWYETPRGSREGDISIVIPNIYSIYKRNFASVFQVGGAVGVRVHSFSRMIVSPFINPKFTYFGRYGWLKFDIPINKKSNRIVLKHHIFFQFGKNTFLSSLEITSRLGDMSRYFSDHYFSNKVLNSDNESNSFSRSMSVNNNLNESLSPSPSTINNNNNNNNDDNRPPILGLPFLFDYKNRITRGSRFFETIHYKIVHVTSATEFGIRRISKLYGTKWQLEIGLKHQITQSGALQCLFTHTIGQTTIFGLSFGFDM
ncbi:hypothetical protein ACTFIY_001148 [Dictyostelium cf. discoideum]